jgi:hypothetical protein
MEGGGRETRGTRAGQSEGGTRQGAATGGRKAGENPFLAFAKRGGGKEKDDQENKKNSDNDSDDVDVVMDTPPAPRAKRVRDQPTTTTAKGASDGSTTALESEKEEGEKAEKKEVVEEVAKEVSTPAKRRPGRPRTRVSPTQPIRALKESVIGLKETIGSQQEEIQQFRTEARAALARGSRTTPTWATVASQGHLASAKAGQGQGQGGVEATRDIQALNQKATNREKVVFVNLGKAAQTLKGKPMAEIKELAQKKLKEGEATKGVKVVGVSAIVGERMEIQMRSKEEAEKARNSAQWVKGLGEEARVEFVIHQSYEEAKAQVEHLLAPMFTDGSVRQGLTGIAVAWKRPFEQQFILQHNKNKCNRLPGQWNVLWETVISENYFTKNVSVEI